MVTEKQDSGTIQVLESSQPSAKMKTPGPASPQSGLKRNWLYLVLALVVGIAVALMPTPHGLSRNGQLVLAVTALTVILWMFRVMSTGIVSILMMGLMIPAGVKPAVALSGFNAPSFWILVAVLFYGFAMQTTGLARRIAYYTLSLFPATYTGISLAFLSMGFALTLGIPSSTVRTAIMVPIAWALVKSLDLEDRSRGAALIILTTVEMAVVPGSAILYGALFGVVIDTLFHTKHLALSWIGYIQVMFVPTVVLCFLILIVNRLVLRPERMPERHPQFARQRLREMGRPSGAEIITGLLVLLSIVFWSTERYHHIPSFFIGMMGVPVLALSGIVREDQIGTAVPWNLLLFLGGAFSLANVIQQYDITPWLAGFLVPIAQRLSFSYVLLLVAIAILMLVLRFLDPSGFVAIPVLFLPLVDVTTAAGIPPLVLAAPLLFAAAPFWFAYQSPWVATAEGMIDNQGFSGSQRALLSTVYATQVIVALVLSVGYWRLLGYLH
jgi:anion transporter